MDLKIAAIVLANNAIPFSRNLTDFSKVPALRVEERDALTTTSYALPSRRKPCKGYSLLTH